MSHSLGTRIAIYPQHYDYVMYYYRHKKGVLMAGGPAFQRFFFMSATCLDNPNPGK